MTVRAWPWRKGLATAGQQSSIPEDALWQAKNIAAGLDGMMSKRPGLKQWGQTIKSPNASATGSAVSFFEPFLDAALPSWVENDGSATKITWNSNQGILQTNTQAGASNEDLFLTRGTGPSSDDASVRFVFQGASLSAYTASGTVADTFAIRLATASTTAKEFAIWSGGLYYKVVTANTYTLVTGTEDVGAGAWSTIEIRLDESGNATVYLDETLVDTIAVAAMADVTLDNSDVSVELRWEVDPTTQYSTKLATFMYNDTAESDAFTVETIRAISSFRATIGSGSLQRTLMCAAGGYVYHDAAQTQVWRPIERWSYSEIEFSQYRKQICWVEHNGLSQSRVWLWAGGSIDKPEEQDEAPQARFGVEHQQRLWLAGDRQNPLRVYYSGDRQPNVWFAPDANNISDRFDVQIDAGYIEVPGRNGDEITAIYGDYYTQILVFTRQSVYRISGFGLQSFQVESVSQETGCESFGGTTWVGNDVWFHGRDGVHNVQTTQKFGNLIKGFLSGPIQDKWGGDPSTVTPVSQTYLSQARMSYHSTLGLVYLAVPLATDQTAQKVFVYNTVSEEWYGPWIIDSQAMAAVEIESPVTTVVMHGGSAGKVLYTDVLSRTDDGTAIESIVESALINGRSLDPKLMGVEKTFKRLRIYLLPRGDWKVKLFWKVDSEFYSEADTNDLDQNVSQNVFKVRDLTDEFRLDIDPDGRLHSREEMGYIEVRLDKRGYSMSFQVKQDGNGEDIAIQGYAVDFVPHGYERD